MTGGLKRFDDTVDRWFDPLRGRPIPDRIFEVASHLGDWSLIWNITTVALALRSDNDLDRSVRTLAGVGIESLVVNQAVKRLFHRPRPLQRPDVAARLRTPSTSSFPSGHASAAAFATVVLCDDEPRLVLFILPAAVVVATSRIYTRMHFPSDVVAGVAIGWLLGRGMLRVEHSLGQSPPHSQ